MKWTVGTKIGLGYAVALAVFAAVSGITYWSTMHFIESNRWVDETNATINQIEHLQWMVAAVDAGERGYLLTGQERFLAPYRQVAGEIEPELKAIRPLIEDTPVQVPRLDGLTTQIRAWLAGSRANIEARRRQGKESARQTGATSHSEDQLEALNRLADQMQEFESQQMKQRRAYEEATSQRTLATIEYGLLVALLAMLVAGYLITRNITRRLQNMTVVAERVAQGDLDVQVDVDGSDEVGMLGRSFAAMVARLRETITRNFEQIAQGNLSTEVTIYSAQDQIGQALKRMVDNLVAMAEVGRQISMGNLNGTIKARNDRDELGKTFEKMILDLRQVASGIQEATNRVSTASNEILAASNEHEKIMQQQTTAINETTSTVTELVRTQQSMTSNTAAIGQLLQKTIDSVTTGNQEVEKAVHSLETIRGSSNATSERIAELSEKVRQIGKIVTTIREVTEQINLLALNAAIEAARAGEQGRGFAVVASEVRKLAERTDRSTADIAELVEDIQSSTNITVLSNEENLKSVSVGVAGINQTASVFGAMHEDVEALADSLEQLILSIRQQEAAFAQIDIAIKEINSGMNQSLQGTRQNVVAAGDLNRTAGTLKEHADRFKL